MNKYIIDPEYKALLPPQTEDERKALEESILADGCRDALIVDETNTIIDGHNRYEICTKHNIPFNVVVRHFDSRDDIIVFICRNQIGRRNLSPDTLSYVIGLMYNLEKKRNGGNRGNQYAKVALTQNEDVAKPITTATRIAKEIGVGRATVERAGQFASAVDALSENEPTVKAAILSGKSGLTRKSVVEIAAMDEEKKKAAVDKIKAGEGRKVVDEMRGEDGKEKESCSKCEMSIQSDQMSCKSGICKTCYNKMVATHKAFKGKGLSRNDFKNLREELEEISIINQEMRNLTPKEEITIQEILDKIEYVVKGFVDQIKDIEEKHIKAIKENAETIKAALVPAEAAIEEIKECIYGN